MDEPPPAWKNKAIRQLESLMAEAANISASSDPSRLTSFETRCMAAIRAIAPDNSPYVERAEEVFEASPDFIGFISSPATRYANVTAILAGVIGALKKDVEGDFLTDLGETIRVESYSDMLEMATGLLSEGPKFKDPAAVIGTVVLEEHLRRLAKKHGVPLETGGKRRNADSLNAELAKQGAYNKTYQKSVVGWLQLRNDSHHADWGKFDAPQVEQMLRGVRDFIAAHPA